MKESVQDLKMEIEATKKGQTEEILKKKNLRQQTRLQKVYWLEEGVEI